MFQTYGVLIFLSEIYWLHQLKNTFEKAHKNSDGKVEQDFVSEITSWQFRRRDQILDNYFEERLNWHCYLVEKHFYFYFIST